LLLALLIGSKRGLGRRRKADDAAAVLQLSTTSFDEPENARNNIKTTRQRKNRQLLPC
jgi:hypothetical protein